MRAWSAQSEILVDFCITQTSIFLLFSTMWLIAEKNLMMHLQNSISSTFSIRCWRYQVAALTSQACYCGNQQHGFVASECFNTSSSGGTKDDRGERQRWDGLLPFPLSFSVTSAPLIHAWIHQWPRTAVFFLPSWVKHLRQYHVFFFCVCLTCESCPFLSVPYFPVGGEQGSVALYRTEGPFLHSVRLSTSPDNVQAGKTFVMEVSGNLAGRPKQPTGCCSTQSVVLGNGTLQVPHMARLFWLQMMAFDVSSSTYEWKSFFNLVYVCNFLF